MKFKLDENLSPELSPLFSEAGHEAHTVLEEHLSGIQDARLFARCVQEGRVLVTLDLDFSNPLRFSPKGAPGVVVLRPVRTANLHVRALVEAVMPSFSERELNGKLWIVEPGRIRVHEPAGDDV